MWRDEDDPSPFGASLGLLGGGTLEEIQAEIEETGDQVLSSWEALWHHPDRAPRRGRLFLSTRGVHFAQGVLVVRRGQGPCYGLVPETEVDFMRDFYFSIGSLELQRDPNGVLVVRLGYSTYAVSDPAGVFQMIYQAKESALLEGARRFPRGGQAPSVAGSPPVVRTVVHEVVKVPCRYCQTLVELTERTCPSCGAALR